MNNIISIVTPSLNQSKYIEQTIESVLSQAGDFFIDYIIADGGSTDETVDLIKKYDQLLCEKMYPIKCRGINFRWWSRPDKGQSHALNQGFSLAQGDILAWINSDDYYEPGTFEIIIGEFRKKNNVDLIYGDCQKINILNHKELISLTRSKQKNFRQMLNSGTSFGQSSVFFTKKILGGVGYLDESLHYAMDFDLWLRISQIGNILYIPQVLSTYRFWDGCKSVNQTKNFAVEIRSICDRYDKNPLSKRRISIFFSHLLITQIIKKRIPFLYKIFKLFLNK